MAIGGRKKHHLQLSLHVAGGWLLLILSAASPCEARWLFHGKTATAIVAAAVAAVVAVVALVVIACKVLSRRRRMASGADEEEEKEDHRGQKMFYGYFAPARVADDPMSINATMVRSPDPRLWSPVRWWAAGSSPPVTGTPSPPAGHTRSAVGLPRPRRKKGSSSGGAAAEKQAASCPSQPRTTTDPGWDISPALPVKLKEFSYQSLAEATTNFHKSKQLGRGSSGVVFEGILVGDEGLKTNVAIKRFHKIISTSQIRGDLKHKYSLKHRNLVTLHGYGFHKGRLYLVYDLMPCGSLDQLLFYIDDAETAGAAANDDDQPRRHVMTWDERCNIVKDAALALKQLHVSNAFHGSVKASNIMLEPGLTGRRARLGDFSYSKVAPAPAPPHHEASSPAPVPPKSSPCSSSSSTGTTAAAAGPSLETDILDFGAVILEVVCGRRRFGSGAGEVKGFTSLVDWVRELHAEGRLHAAVDPKLAGKFDRGRAVDLLLVGLKCSHQSPKQRPTIDEVRMAIINGSKPPPENYVPAFGEW